MRSRRQHPSTVQAETVDAIVKNSGKDLNYALLLAGITKQEYDMAKEIAEGKFDD